MAYTPTVCVILTITGLCVSWVFVSLRFYVRGRMIRLIGYDDLTALFALVLFTVECVFYLIALCEYGFGKHLSPVTQASSISLAMKNFFIAELLFFIASTIIKISFTLTLFRITHLKAHRYCLYAILVITSVMGIVQFFLVLLSCKPVKGFWTSVLDPTSATCDLVTGVRASYAHGAVSVLVDVVIGILIPLHLIYNLQMQLRVKIAAVAVLALGSLASIATILRINYTANTDLTDILYAANVPYIWAIIELSTSIICTSATTLKPLLVAWKMFHSTNGPSGPSYDMENMGSKKKPSTTGSGYSRAILSGKTPSSKDHETNSSTEEITWPSKDFNDGPKIKKTIGYEQRVDQRGEARYQGRREVWDSHNESWLNS